MFGGLSVYLNDLSVLSLSISSYYIIQRTVGTRPPLQNCAASLWTWCSKFSRPIQVRLFIIILEACLFFHNFLSIFFSFFLEKIITMYTSHIQYPLTDTLPMHTYIHNTHPFCPANYFILGSFLTLPLFIEHVEDFPISTQVSISFIYLFIYCM